MITSPGEKVKLTVQQGNENPMIINKKEGTVSGVSIVSKSEEVPMDDSKNAPLYLLDSKEINAAEMKELDANAIKAIKVLKGENAMNKYGEKGKNGAVEIETKTKDEQSISKEKIIIKTINKKGPIFYVDGKETTNEDFNKVVSDKIESINVMKGENAIKKYGEKGKDGVVEILMKKPVT